MIGNLFSRFFSNVQEATWYREFLDAIVDEIPERGHVLDIGTGSGKLLQILWLQKSCTLTGTDTSEAMLSEAAKKLKGSDAELIRTMERPPYPMQGNMYDSITICNLLFLLPEKDGQAILNEALRLLKPSGKIFILTSSGQGGLLKLTWQYFSMRNLSIFLWYLSTKNRARKWQQNYLQLFCKQHELEYIQKIVLKGFGMLEIISRK
jgi:ubiquinone/menaquinone biosynthesis C-methylase UbiE